MGGASPYLRAQFVAPDEGAGDPKADRGDSSNHITSSQAEPAAGANPHGERLPNQGSSNDQFRISVISIAIVAILASGVTKFATAGWYIIVLGLPLIAVLVVHFFVHRSTSRVPKPALWLLVLAIVSDLFLLGGFLLQLDIGDNPNPWLTITALTSGGPGYAGSDAPSWWPTSIAINFLVLVPVALSWVLLLVLSVAKASRKLEADR